MKNEQKTHLVRGLWIAVCLLILCFNVITLSISLLDLRQQTGWLPYGLLAVETGSMEPELSQGDLLLIQDVPFEELEVGDTVTFHDTQGFVTHRIVGEENGRYITQGLANTMADQVTMGADTYCGKVVGHVPVLGWPVQAINASPMVMVLGTLLVFMLCLGQPLLEEIYYQKVHGKAAKYTAKRAYLPRAVTCAALVSLLLSTPAMTEAKYLTKLQRFELVVADPVYFSSNYMSEGEGNSYSIQGWTGSSYQLNLEVRNYDNELLYNEEGTDLHYALALNIVKTCGHYNISLKPAESDYSSTGHTFPYPEEWANFNQYEGSTENAWNGYTKGCYTIPGGEKQSHRFQILVEPLNPDMERVENDEVVLEIYACTAKDETYYQELKGTFSFRVTAQTEFLGNREIEDKGSLVTLTQYTNLLNDGSDGERLVVFRWNPEELYINEYQRTAFNAIHGAGSHYSKENGYLYMRLQAYAKIELEFFKKSGFTGDVGWNDFAIAVVDSTESPLPDFPSGGEAGS